MFAQQMKSIGYGLTHVVSVINGSLEGEKWRLDIIKLCFPCFAFQDNVLATMHGAKAFKDFVDKKSTRLPEFLHSVEQQNTQQNQIENLLREVTSKSPEITEKRRSHANIHTHS